MPEHDLTVTETGFDSGEYIARCEVCDSSHPFGVSKAFTRGYSPYNIGSLVLEQAVLVFNRFTPGISHRPRLTPAVGIVLDEQRRS